jgi:hypothetical protein
MIKKFAWSLVSLACAGSAFSEEEGKISEYLLTRADSLPVESFEDATDPYLEGYIQALIDMHYYEFQVLVAVKNHKVYLSHMPKNRLLATSILSFVQDMPYVKSVEVKEEFTPEEMSARQKYVEVPQVEGIWFPQSTVLFAPLVADPRQPINSAAVRFDDPIAGNKAVAVSLGDDFPIFRWRDVFWWHGDLQLACEGGIWAIFNFTEVPPHSHGDRCSLVNTDYFVGFPLTYGVDEWSFRLRPYHISSHLGDEFLCIHTKEVSRRKNPSFEALDFFASYQVSSGFRVYAGPGVVFHSDKSFHLKPLYFEWGAEVRLMGQKFYYHRLWGTPFFAMHLENWQQHHWNLDATFRLGYEFSKLQGVGRKVRLYVSYHQGYSYEGQFFNRRTKYGEVGLSWGF